MQFFFTLHVFWLLTISGFSVYGANTHDSTKSLHLSHWAFEVLNIPQAAPATKQKIVVAVIDDGFRLSHNSLKDFLFTNPGEVPGNMIDDDGNGYMDDTMGWDVSDNDNTVEIDHSLEKTHFHGTFIASLITRIASESFGSSAAKTLQILPVKVLSDHSRTTAIIDGYQGIKYAVEMGADIICCGWSGGSPSAEEQKIIQAAIRNNILMIGSAGNTKEGKADFPSSMAGFCAVSALDTLLRKCHDSNYGMRIDLSLPGEKVRSAHPVADNAWFYGRGTSAAAGLAAGCAAVLKGIVPEALPAEVIEALKNTALPVDSINLTYCGKLGGGLPDLSAAVKYLSKPDSRSAFFDQRRPEGSIYINSGDDRTSWSLTPSGAYQSISFVPQSIRNSDLKKTINIFTRDTLYFSEPLEKFKSGITIPGSEAHIRFNSVRKRDRPSKLKINYYVQTIDSSRLYCSEVFDIEATAGTITDNSGAADYANNTACSWHIIAPDCSRIQFDFSSFDTEAKVDFVWLFDGHEAHPDLTIAKFSGSELPPSITSRTNKVKVWFVTDDRNTGAGWELHFKGQ